MRRAAFISVLVTLACRVSFGATYVLHGTIITPDTVITDGRLVVEGGTITAIGATVVVPAGATVVDVDGVIAPGLIDLHNHITWNALPRWKPPQPVEARYDWLATDEYRARLEHPQYAARDHVACELEWYGEIKAIIHGATSVTGSLGPTKTIPNTCVKGLARNLDVASGLFGDEVNKEPLLYKVFPFELSVADATSMRDALASGKPVVVHLAEGTNESAAREFKMAKSEELLKPGLTIIHGIALRRENFEDMAKAGVGLVWSPRSNLELYHRTTDVRAAKAANVSIALSPDWSPSGSNGMLDELRYIGAWNGVQTPPIFTDAELVGMATSTPAHLARIDDKVGKLQTGMRADIVVIRRAAATPYAAVTSARPEDVELVIVNGRAVYGDPKIVRALTAGATLQPLTVCGSSKVLDLSDANDGKGISLEATLKKLEVELRNFDIALAPLVDCISTQH